MRIHYFSSSTLISDSANSVHVMKMAEALASLGHNVTLHALQGDEACAEDVFDYYSIDRKHRFKLALHNLNSVLVCRFLRVLNAYISGMRINGLSSLIFGFFRLRHAENADLLFSRNLFWLFPLRNKVPFIYEVHAPPATAIHKYLEKKLSMSKNCYAIVVISEKLREIYLEIYPEIRKKIIVAHDGAENPKGFNRGHNKRAKRRVKNVGYVGQLYKGRGIDIIAKVAKELPDICFHIVGGQPGAIAKLSATSPSNMHYHGHRPYKDLSSFYVGFDIVLAPYQREVAVQGNDGDTSRFMSPLKLFEYMAWGIPIICSNLPVLKEIFSDHANAILVAPDSATEWVDAIKNIQSNTTLRALLIKNARHDFVHNYTWEIRARRILETANKNNQSSYNKAASHQEFF